MNSWAPLRSRRAPPPPTSRGDHRTRSGDGQLTGFAHGLGRRPPGRPSESLARRVRSGRRRHGWDRNHPGRRAGSGPREVRTAARRRIAPEVRPGVQWIDARPARDFGAERIALRVPTACADPVPIELTIRLAMEQRTSRRRDARSLWRGSACHTEESPAAGRAGSACAGPAPGRGPRRRPAGTGTPSAEASPPPAGRPRLHDPSIRQGRPAARSAEKVSAGSRACRRHLVCRQRRTRVLAGRCRAGPISAQLDPPP